MAVHVTCPECKQQVPFGRLFCTYCGAKLELTQANVSNKISLGEATAKIRKVVIRLVVLLVLACVIGVFLWPMDPPGKTGSPADARLCEQRIVFLRTRVLNGVVMTESFGEAEVNAWLKETLTNTTDLAAGAGFSLRALNLAFKSGKVIEQSRLGLGPVTISYTLEGKVRLEAGGTLGFSVTDVRIGHVPMPEVLHEFFAERALNPFTGLRREADLIAKLKRLEVRDGVVQVSNAGQ